MVQGKTLAVYTVIMGNGYVLPSVEQEESADFLYFTDQVDIQNNGWKIVPCTPLIPTDLPRSSREQKIRPHRWLQDYRQSLYIDTSVKLTAPASLVWNYLIPDESVTFGFFSHSYRETLSEEFDAVLDAGLDHPHVLSEFREAITHSHPTVLTTKPLWGGFIARRHMSPICIETMEQWFAYVLRYSRRDQLSLPVIMSSLSRTNINVRSDSIHKSNYHVWPTEGYARPAHYFHGYRKKKEKKTFPQKIIKEMRKFASKIESI